MEEELEQAQAIYNLVVNFFVNYSFQIIGAIIIMVLGMYVGNKVSGMLEGLLVKKKIDITLSHFVSGFVKILIITMAAIIALGKLGISVTPFVAAIGALALGAGLALQGLLSNYSAGLSIIVTRPFVVGDTISVQGVTGVVKEVKLACTVLTNEDEVRILIPNRHIVGEIIHNSFANTIIESVVGIAYASDPEQAITVIKRALQDTKGINSEREPQVGIDGFGDSSIDIGMRFWVPTESLFDIKYRANQAVFKALAQNNIEIPFPQRDVRLLQQAENS